MAFYALLPRKTLVGVTTTPPASVYTRKCVGTKYEWRQSKKERRKKMGKTVPQERWTHGKKEESTMSKASTSSTRHMLQIYRPFNLASSSDTVVACRLSTTVAAMVTSSRSAISCCCCCCVVVVVESLVWQQTDGQITGRDRWSNGNRSPCILLVVE
jgi:hypothetical protein